MTRMTIDSKVEKIKEAEGCLGDDLAGKERDDFLAQKRQQELDEGAYDLDARKRYGERIFWLVVAWIAVVLVIVVVSGYSNGPKLSDGVLIALITGLSVNVIGLLAIVINYLFPKRGKD